MSVFFTTHAQERFQQRGIVRSMIRTALQNPDSIGNANNGNTFVVKRLKGKELKIIFKDKGDHQVIITAYFVS